MQKARRHGISPLRPFVGARVSLPCSGCFSPFPRGTSALSVSRECLALPGGPGGFRQDSSCPALLGIRLGTGSTRPRDYHPPWPAFPGRSSRLSIPLVAVPRPRRRLDGAGLGSAPFARRYRGYHCCFLFQRVLGCFGSPRSPPLKGMTASSAAGLPHSDSPGSTVTCTSPGSFVAYHVLLRLREPGHPPRALAR